MFTHTKTYSVEKLVVTWQKLAHPFITILVSLGFSVLDCVFNKSKINAIPADAAPAMIGMVRQPFRNGLCLIMRVDLGYALFLSTLTSCCETDKVSIYEDCAEIQAPKGQGLLPMITPWAKYNPSTKAHESRTMKHSGPSDSNNAPTEAYSARMMSAGASISLIKAALLILAGRNASLHFWLEPAAIANSTRLRRQICDPAETLQVQVTTVTAHDSTLQMIKGVFLPATNWLPSQFFFVTLVMHSKASEKGEKKSPTQSAKLWLIQALSVGCGAVAHLMSSKERNHPVNGEK
ncbi:hypothetical protein B0H13DRAFT_1917589 [Mycena leptocephala]|nr:hypothetical protein B0H13DRAFT_1917589 [Mycena leptocephala]